jgi:hypothetical protein
METFCNSCDYNSVEHRSIPSIPDWRLNDRDDNVSKFLKGTKSRYAFYMWRTFNLFQG